jgi:nucleoside 2-deoxyribosyltransferase
MFLPPEGRREIMGRLRIYISGPLTNQTIDKDEIERLRRFYEAIAEVCQRKGHAPYVPHQHTDPIIHPEISPVEVYKTDMREIGKADLVLAYVGKASHGVGMEIERAYHTGTKVVLLYERGTKISRLVKGCPAVIAEIEFEEADDALRQVSMLLDRWQECGTLK